MIRGKKSVRFLACFFLCFSWMVFLAGCANNSLENRDTDISSSLSYERSMELQYAGQFAVDYYKDGYTLLSVADGRSYLVIPEGEEAPEDLREGIIVLKRPLEQIYLVASAVMDMFCALDGVEQIRFCGQEAENWCIEEAREAMEQGRILYAGKYDMPDYELLVSEGCSLAVENNMVTHAPEVLEKLADFGIPSLVDCSSYEDHPLGRVEWVKFYGVLLGKETEAEAAFAAQAQQFQQIAAKESSGKTVAFFYITTNGMVNVRVSADYVPKMIEFAGGKYIFDGLGREDSRRSSVIMQMEEFYQKAKDADYLIYNSTVDKEPVSMEDLLQKESLLEDFQAVQEGRVFCTTRDLYQQSMSMGQMIEDIHHMLLGHTADMKYLYQLQ